MRTIAEVSRYTMLSALARRGMLPGGPSACGTDGPGALSPDAVRGPVPRSAKMRYPMGALGRGCRGAQPSAGTHNQQRAIGSAGERLVHTEEVTGSIPVSPTQLSGRFRSWNRPLLGFWQQQTAATVMPASH